MSIILVVLNQNLENVSCVLNFQTSPNVWLFHWLVAPRTPWPSSVVTPQSHLEMLALDLSCLSRARETISILCKLLDKCSELVLGLFRPDSRGVDRVERSSVVWSPREQGSWLDQRFSEAMGCCSMDTLVSGCCCCNAAIVLPPKIGCRGDIMVCCADVTCCFDLCSICNPGACCCCGPTCKCNATLCKLKCTVFCFDVQGSCPCDSDTPIICMLLPCCTIYPRIACCATRASIVNKPTASDAPKNETMDRGSPPRKGLQVV